MMVANKSRMEKNKLSNVVNYNSINIILEF